MEKTRVARVLEEIAAMLEVAGENLFKARAYAAAARAVLSFPGDLEAAVESRELLDVPGIGKSLFASIETLVKTGSLPYYDELRARYPPGLSEFLRIPGLGARKARQLHETLGVDSLEALEKACREGRLTAVRGFGPATMERILKGIAVVRSNAGLHRYPRARRKAEEILEALRAAGLTSRIEIAGSLRRRKEIIRDIDIVAASPDPAALSEAFRRLPGASGAVAEDPRTTSIRFADGFAADLRAVPGAAYPAALLDFSGSRDHLAQLRGRAGRLGLELNANGLFASGSAASPLSCAGESEIYAQLGLAFIEPELREGRGEIEAAEAGALPRLLEETDLRGVIHLHTTGSDGRDTLESMVAAARDRGYSYAAITDHSKSAAYAGGLDEERVLAQREEIRTLSRRFPGFRIFHGTEADILSDGSIDFGDEFLQGFDIVVASVHSRFGLPREEQTRRLIRAVRNPRVSVLGHPSGRLLLSREGLIADWDAVLAAAAESGCAVEINCNPERLDLDWRLCRAAAAAGILFSIGPDAHSVGELGLVSLGVGIARKGWITPAAALNAMNTEALVDWLERRRGARLPGS